MIKTILINIKIIPNKPVRRDSENPVTIITHAIKIGENIFHEN